MSESNLAIVGEFFIILFAAIGFGLCMYCTFGKVIKKPAVKAPVAKKTSA